MLARLMEIQIWHLPVPIVGGLRKGTMASDSTFLWEKSDPPSLALNLNNLLPLHLPLAPFKLLCQCWSSEGVSPSKSMSGPFKKNAWDCRNLSSHSATISTGFHSQKSWELLFLALEPWTGASDVALGLHTLQGGPQSRYLS